MPRRKPTPADSRHHLRRAIATTAARLMAEEGSTDYATAKRKAARSLGAEHSENLPTNDEIQTELCLCQTIYPQDEQDNQLQTLRQTALNVMQLLNEFQPRLTGAVLDGTATRYSPIHLQLVADNSKDVEIWLLTHQIAFDTECLPHQNHRSSANRFVLDLDDTTVLLDILSIQQKHGGALSATLADVRTLLTHSTAASPLPESQLVVPTDTR